MSDLIDRQALIESLYESFVKAQEWVFEASDAETKVRAKSAVATFVEAILRVKNMPKVEQKIDGIWLPAKTDRGGHECSKCHAYAPSFRNGTENLSRFCPSCGVYMGEEV